MLTLGSAAEARRAVDQGIDIVVAQGWEAGGHVWGEVSTMVLVPAVVDAVPDTPGVAAGGPASGKRPGEGEVLARRPDGREVVRYTSISPRDTLDGRIEALSLWSGQSVGLVHDVLPATEIVRRTVAEAERILDR